MLPRMNTRNPRFAAVVCLLAGWLLSTAVTAEVTAIEGSAEVTIRQLRNGAQTDFNTAFKNFPETTDVFPLRVIASIFSLDPGAEGGGVAIAQLADPTELFQPNPAEFAINMAIDSRAADLRYDGRARLIEQRSILLGPADTGAEDGQTATVRSRLFLDGALALHAVAAGADMTGAGAVLSLTVNYAGPDGARTLFTGEIALDGAAGGNAAASSSGGLATALLFLADLSNSVDEFAVLRALIIPNLEIEYVYDVVTGQPFTLTATLDLKVDHPGDGVGASAVIGTPVDALARVLEVTSGEPATTKLIRALQDARAAPSGDVVGGQAPRLTAPGLCGLLGFELLALLPGLYLVRCGSRPRRPARP
jgi:hypothetical protein